jgi:hypothetical protein
VGSSPTPVILFASLCVLPPSQGDNVAHSLCGVGPLYDQGGEESFCTVFDDALVSGITLDSVCLNIMVVERILLPRQLALLTDASSRLAH